MLKIILLMGRWPTYQLIPCSWGQSILLQCCLACNMEMIIVQGSAWKNTKCYATLGLLILLLLYILIDEILINGKAALLPPPPATRPVPRSTSPSTLQRHFLEPHLSAVHPIKSSFGSKWAWTFITTFAINKKPILSIWKALLLSNGYWVMIPEWWEYRNGEMYKGKLHRDAKL